jgi:hypothetical protein
MLKIDNDTPVKGSPLNGDALLAVSREGSFQEMALDLEQSWSELPFIVFKCYDHGGNIVTFKVKRDVVWTAFLEQMVEVQREHPGIQ